MIKTVSQDLYQTLINWRICCHLATEDIQLRYRESIIGPFWITISMAMTISVLGFLYGHLFGANRAEYFPYVAAGMVSWYFLSTLIQESGTALVKNKPLVENIALPYSMFLIRSFLKNLIILAHNMIAFFIVAILYSISINWQTLLFIPAIILIGINVVLWGTTISIIGARFRDFSEIISSLVRVIFYITPVMWLPDFLPEKYQFYINLNPFYHLIAIMRLPILGQSWTIDNMLAIAIITLLGIIAFGISLGKYKDRIIFWL